MLLLIVRFWSNGWNKHEKKRQTLDTGSKVTCGTMKRGSQYGLTFEEPQDFAGRLRSLVKQALLQSSVPFPIIVIQIGVSDIGEWVAQQFGGCRMLALTEPEAWALEARPCELLILCDLPGLEQKWAPASKKRIVCVGETVELRQG